MQTSISLGFGFTIAMLLSACGGSGSSISYNFSSNGCQTGEQSFKGLEQYCSGLQDEKLNNGCALDSRKEAFAEKCTGQTWATANVGTSKCGDQTCDGLTQYCLTSYVGALETPAVPAQCRTLPSGSVFDDSDLTCDLLVKDARIVFSGVENCKQSTFCEKRLKGGYALDCHSRI